MARGRSGVISKEYKGEENTAYHDVIKLFKIYRAVNWQMQIKINQVKRRFHMEYRIGFSGDGTFSFDWNVV